MARSQLGQLVAIVGQTGTGKSALALRIAEYFDGEVIAADSRTIYRDMDIGTAKPTLEDQEKVPHYGLDIINPSQNFSAYDFKGLALEAIKNITSRGKLPLLVGGTGLYIDAVLYDFVFRPAPDLRFRERLRELSIEALQHRIVAAGLPLPENSKNPLHLQRVLESGIAPRQSQILRENTLVLGISVPPEELRERLKWRASRMIRDGLVSEGQSLYEKYGNVSALRAPAYRALLPWVEGMRDLEEVKQQIVHNDMLLAKKQRTWFRRNRHIIWLRNEDKFAEAVDIITTFLNRHHISS